MFLYTQKNIPNDIELTMMRSIFQNTSLTSPSPRPMKALARLVMLMLKYSSKLNNPSVSNMHLKPTVIHSTARTTASNPNSIFPMCFILPSLC